MKPSSAKLFTLLLSLLLLLSFNCLSLSDSVPPLDEQAQNIPPHEDNYKFDDTHDYAVAYEDPTLKITLTDGRYMDTTWTAARIKIKYPTQLRTMMSAKYGNNSTQLASVLAKRANAVLAINGDWFMARNNIGSVIRQGKKYRERCNGDWDILGIDDQGDLHIIKKARNEDIQNFKGELINTFTFGPALIIDGKPISQEDIDNNEMGPNHGSQRMAIGQIGKLEYICVCCEGPEDPGSTGLTVKQFADLIASFGDVKTAYNLDGGSSSTMVFKTKESPWEKINAPQNPKKRLVGDIIYFTTAFEGNKTEGTSNS